MVEITTDDRWFHEYYVNLRIHHAEYGLLCTLLECLENREGLPKRDFTYKPKIQLIIVALSEIQSTYPGLYCNRKLPPPEIRHFVRSILPPRR